MVYSFFEKAALLIPVHRYDLPTVLTKWLTLGMPLEEVVRRSTSVAAAAIGWEDRIGTLGIGREADIAVLELENVSEELEDCHGQMRRIDRRLVPRAVWRAGERGAITEPLCRSNRETIEAAKAWVPRLVVRDAPA